MHHRMLFYFSTTSQQQKHYWTNNNITQLMEYIDRKIGWGKEHKEHWYHILLR